MAEAPNNKNPRYFFLYGVTKIIQVGQVGRRHGVTKIIQVGWRQLVKISHLVGCLFGNAFRIAFFTF